MTTRWSTMSQWKDYHCVSRIGHPQESRVRTQKSSTTSRWPVYQGSKNRDDWPRPAAFPGSRMTHPDLSKKGVTKNGVRTSGRNEQVRSSELSNRNRYQSLHQNQNFIPPEAPQGLRLQQQPVLPHSRRPHLWVLLEALTWETYKSSPPR